MDSRKFDITFLMKKTRSYVCRENDSVVSTEIVGKSLQRAPNMKWPKILVGKLELTPERDKYGHGLSLI